MSIGFTEILLILLLALLLFGAKRLPELARSLGRAVKEFKQGITDLDKPAASSDHTPADQTQPSAPPAAAKPQA